MKFGKRNKSGFTLVEVSIVLVIVGLLIGGILVAQSLVKTAELNRLITDIQQYETVVNLFQDRFRTLPGDSANGARFGVGVNGNANGRIDDFDTGSSQHWAINEQLVAWQIISNVGMLEVQYTGSGATIEPGINVPETINGAGICFTDNIPTSSYEYGFAIGGGGHATNMLGYNMGGFLSPSDVYAIDLKIDDGSASNGRVRPRLYVCYDLSLPSYYALNSSSGSGAGSGSSGGLCPLYYFHFDD